MKNITVFAVLVIILFCTQHVPAQEQRAYAVSVRPLFGLVSGHAEELVYPAGDTKAPLLSELLWNMKPVFFYGVLLDFSQIRPIERWGFFSNISVKNGIPGPSGNHENRDWMSVENTNITHYSKHDNYTRELLLLDASAGFSFPHKKLLFKTYVNVSYMRFSFYGKDGQGTYARQQMDSFNNPVPGLFYPITSNPYVVPWEGKVISYSQDWLYVAPGISAGYYFFDKFFAELSFIASPLVFCVGLDEHKTTNVQYKDNMRGGILLEPGLRLSYTAGRWLGIFWDISWRFANGTRGASYNRSPIGTGAYIKEGEAGAGLSIMTTGFGLNVRL
ncbi:MAG: omptin family outer membrane protease [Treponema sp.]|nr:omptin family outer membrane protease [Treponema sp.]